MSRSPRAMPVVLLLVVVVLAGCGGSGSASTARTLASTAFRISAHAGTSLPVRYTCDGGDVSPALEWGVLPAGTASLALFVVGLKPEPSTHTYQPSVEWALAGLSPTLHGLEAGRLPAGAYVGLASDGKRGYSICPAKGLTEEYQFELYGLPAAAVVSHDFSGLEVLGQLESTKSTPAIVRGAFAVTYTRH